MTSPSPSPSPSPPGSGSSSAMATPAPIEAHSLGLLHALADSPLSRRPDFEASYSRRGLLLWIVRVPDSKDIILTPLTPARGATSATVADIAASMYYLHLRHDTSAVSTGVRATLIRRVPATEDQWNVANICESEHGGEEVVLEMLGHGYRRLAAGGESGGGGGGGGGGSGGEVMAAGSGGPRISRKPVPDSAQQPPPPPPPPPQELPPLVRTMRIEGEGFWHRLKSRRKKSDERIEDAAGGVPARKKKKRDYVFDGLWSDARGVSVGRCEFKDESAGKYLKCKYYPAPPSSSSAAAAGSGYHHLKPPEPEKSTLLSVLEFKLGMFNQHKRSHSTSSTHHHHHHHHHGDKQRAKMGMLIIHGPGQEMLDLLVAANMAAFMKRWEGWARERSALGGF